LKQEWLFKTKTFQKEICF